MDTSDGYWMFETEGYAVGDGEVVYPDDGLYPMIADTGTTLLMLEDDIVHAYYAQVVGADMSRSLGGIVFPCGSVLPDLAVLLFLPSIWFMGRLVWSVSCPSFLSSLSLYLWHVMEWNADEV